MGIIPLRRPACWRDARWLGLCNKLREHTPDTGALGDASDHAHLACANRAQQKERLVGAGDQRLPQTVSRALGLHVSWLSGNTLATSPMAFPVARGGYWRSRWG